jgi:hypothetical protein
VRRQRQRTEGVRFVSGLLPIVVLTLATACTVTEPAADNAPSPPTAHSPSRTSDERGIHQALAVAQHLYDAWQAGDRACRVLSGPAQSHRPTGRPGSQGLAARLTGSPCPGYHKRRFWTGRGVA